jgi:hypothetical protein
MYNPRKNFLFGILFSLQLFSFGCGVTVDTLTSTTGLISAGDLVKTWTSGCINGSDTITSASKYILTLYINSSTNYSYTQTWYSGACSPVNYAIAYTSTGTFTVSGLASGSATLQSIAFDVTSSDLMPFTTTIQTAVNADCGGTSPFIGGVNTSFNGTHSSTYMMNCASQDFPNSARRTVNNVFSYSGGVLTLGASYNGIPGVYNGNTVPATATVDFN